MWAARGLAHVPYAKIVVHELGNGRNTSAYDTVPYALWAAARNLNDYEQALWTTASTGGDIDTTCAIVGGIVAARVGIDGVPEHWRSTCEQLPDWTMAALGISGDVAEPSAGVGLSSVLSGELGPAHSA